KEADDKIKEGTLNLNDGTNAIRVVFGKEKGGYARGVESRVTYKRVMENQSNVQNHLVEIQADELDLLVNSDNENDDMLRYESEKYSNDEDADGTNHAEDADGTNHSNLKLVKRGMTRLYKFRREYGKPSEIKIKRYFDVDLTVRKLVMHYLGKLLRNFRMKLREKYILPNLNTPTKLNELPTKYSAIVKAEEWVEFVNYMTTDVYKKQADDKIKEGTLNLDDGTDAMTVVFGKEKEDYARGVGSGVTYKKKDVLVKKLSTKMTDKDVLVKKLSNKMTETKGMLSQLMNQLAVQGVIPMGAYEVDKTQSSVVVCDKDARIQKSNGLVTLEKEPV
nr:hypothetical protein [Tanacetum cinerariifolium]